MNVPTAVVHAPATWLLLDRLLDSDTGIVLCSFNILCFLLTFACFDSSLFKNREVRLFSKVALGNLLPPPSKKCLEQTRVFSFTLPLVVEVLRFQPDCYLFYSFLNSVVRHTWVAQFSTSTKAASLTRHTCVYIKNRSSFCPWTKLALLKSAIYFSSSPRHPALTSRVITVPRMNS